MLLQPGARRPGLTVTNVQRLPPRFLVSLRVSQSRLTARILTLVGRSSVGRSLICRVRNNPVAGAALSWLLAFRGTFASLAEAEVFVARYVPTGHEDPSEHELQVAKAETTRESDYPMLFFLAPLSAELRSVFDLGGGISNLFYVLDRHLQGNDIVTVQVAGVPMQTPQACFGHAKPGL
jgi:hypothetical protein